MLKYYILILIFLNIFQYSKQQCQDCIYNNGDDFCSTRTHFSFETVTCDTSRCKPRFRAGGCYSCSTNTYYTIEGSSCTVNWCNGNKIIYETNECTSQIVSVNSLYNLGDVYYYRLPAYASCNENRVCVCNSYYVKNYIQEKLLKYTCLDLVNSLPPSNYNYYDPITKEFFFYRCPEELNHMKLNELKSRYTRCTKFCDSNEWNIEIRTGSEEVKLYCVNSCQDNTHSPDTNYIFMKDFKLA